MVQGESFYLPEGEDMSKPENWIKWDLDSRTGLKMSAYFSEYGATGYGVFLFFTESLYRAHDHKLGVSTGEYNAYSTACKVSVEEIRDMLNTLFDYGLFQYDGDCFWSNRVLEEIESRNIKAEEQRTQKSVAGKLGAAKRWEAQNGTAKHSIAQDGTTIADDSTHMAEMARLDKTRLDKKRVNILTNPNRDKAKYRTFNAEDFKFPTLFGNQARAAVEKWVSYKEAAGHPKLLLSYQQEIDDYADRPKDYVAYVNRAISNQWQGFNQKIPLDNKTGQLGKGEWKSISEKQVEKNVEVLNQIRAREAEEEKANEAR